MMKLPLSWLREHVDVRVEPARLAERLTLVGLAVDAIERHGEETVLDIDVTTNRVDCMNVRGIAREVAVTCGLPLLRLALDFEESGPPAAEALAVEVLAPDLCPRFCARVLDVRMGPSPAWIRDRLELVGVRPISNVVDLTNYAMMEMGHPSHAFDLARVPEGRLRVRWAREGERLRTLDDVERALGARVGVVAGPEAALALAGIMGGATSEVGGDTRVVALEAAYWDPLSIRRGAKALGIHTEASHRFERGADPEGPVAATARIAHLLGRIGSGSARPGLIDRYPRPQPRRVAPYRSKRAEAVLGAQVPEARAREVLEGLGFTIETAADSWSVGIPTWRGDVAREADLIEEVGRHHGLDKIPSTIPPAARPGGLTPAQSRERRLRELLAGAGLTEVIRYAFVSRASDPGPCLRLENPLSEEQSVLRTSLVMPGLLEALSVNLSQGRRDVRIFELGRVFRPAATLAREESTLGLLLAGAAHAAHWSQKPRAADFFDLKGLLELALGSLGCPVIETGESEGVPTFLHPGKCALVRCSGEVRGYLGALHPDVASTLGLRDETLVAEVGIEGLIARVAAPLRHESLPRHPAVSRDLSVLCDRSLPAAQLLGWVRHAAGPLLRAVGVAELYAGPPVPEGKVSLMLALRYQHPERTLTGGEVQASVDAVAAYLRARGAEIRGE